MAITPLKLIIFSWAFELRNLNSTLFNLINIRYDMPLEMEHTIFIADRISPILTNKTKTPACDVNAVVCRHIIITALIKSE
jgi:hypothetical protein